MKIIQRQTATAALEGDIARLESRLKKSIARLEREYQKLRRLEWQDERPFTSKPRSEYIDEQRAKVAARESYQNELRNTIAGLRARCASIEKRSAKLYDELSKDAKGEVSNIIAKFDTAESEKHYSEAISLSNDDSQRDIFISHASEDKEFVVRPLVHYLEELEISLWYDEYALRIGDSLRRSIDKGLSHSRYGVVVISPDFLRKEWTQYELDSLTAREMSGTKVILPIWHKVSRNEILEYSPKLADKYALRTSDFTLEEIALQIADMFSYRK